MKKRNIKIAANWKMNKTPRETKKLIEEILKRLKTHKCDITLFVPYVDLSTAVECIEGSDIKIGAQNCHFERLGAFTGEISVDMLKEIGVSSVIVGHSERRKYFNETDVSINKKIKLLISENMETILCVGETLREMQESQTINVITNQIKAALDGIKKENILNVTIAYEPIWAIGTGKTATPEKAENVCREIRKIVENLYDKDIADKLIVQYGGSVSSNNAFELLSQENIDGALIGGASLRADEFVKIVDKVTLRSDA